MKKHAFFSSLLFLLSFFAEAQFYTATQIRLRNNSDSTSTGAQTGGTIRHDPATDAYRFWDNNCLCWTSPIMRNASNFWKLSGTSTLSGNATITSNAPNQHLFNGAWAASADNQSHMVFDGTLTSDAVASSNIMGYKFNPTFISGGGATQRAIALDVQPSITGFTHNVALRIGGGKTVIGNGLGELPISSAQLTIRGLSTGTNPALLLANSVGTSRLEIRDNGQTFFTSSNGNTFNFTSTFSATASGLYGFNLAGNITGRAASGSGDTYFQFGHAQGLTTGNTNQTVTAFRATGTYTFNHTGATLIGFDWNPTIAGIETPQTYLAWRNTSGQLLFGGSTITAGSVLADFQSTNSGIAVPRVTSRASVTSPFSSLIDYDASTGLFEFFEAGNWRNPVWLDKTQTLTNKTFTSPILDGASAVGDVWTATNTGGAGAWQTPVSGIGGSTGSTDNAILRADGTGGSTLQSSPVTISDNGSPTFGISGVTTGTTRSILVQGIETDINLVVSSKGAGETVVFGSNSAINLGTSGISASGDVFNITSQDSSIPGTLRLSEASINGTNYLGLKSATSLGSDITYTWPATAPTSDGQVMSGTMAGVMSWIDPTGQVLMSQVTVTSAQILSSNTTPVQIVAAPGAGKIINLIRATSKLVYNSIAYDGTPSSFLVLGTSASNFVTPGINMIGGSVTKWSMFDASSALSFTTDLENEELNFMTTASDPTSGNSDLIVTVYYTIVDHN